MASTPIFVATAQLGHSRPSAANTASDGSGTEGVDIFTIVTATANGTRVDSIKVMNSQNTYALSTALIVRVFITDTSGNNPRLFDEITMAAATRSASAVGASNVVNYAGGLFLASGQKIKVTVSVFNAASQVDVTARGGNM